MACLLLVFGSFGNAAAPPPTGRAHAETAPSIEMANVQFRYTDDISVLVLGLRGRLAPTAAHEVPSFNRPASFTIETDAAEMGLDTVQLTLLMNKYVLSDPDAQMKSVQIGVEGDHLRMKGTMKKGISLPFQATGALSVTPDNRLRIAITQMKTLKIPVKGLMDVLGLSMQKLVSQKGLKGISVEGDSLLLDPQTAFPDPQLRAKLRAVRTSGASVLLSFGTGDPKLSRAPYRNYMRVMGGSIQYGREQMNDADIVLIDTTPADPFDFNLSAYKQQFAASTLHLTPEMGLRASVPDYGKLGRAKAR